MSSAPEDPKLAGKLPALVPQTHGGALYVGGVPGHTGAGGRPPSAIRERLRGSFEERVTILEEIADDPTTDPQDRIRAIDLLAKYGLGAVRELTHDEVRERLRGTLAVIRRNLSTSQAERIVSQLREVWR